MRSNLIVFDIDGTLTDTVPLHKEAFVKALTQMGLAEIDTNFNAYRHHTDYHIAKAIYEKATGAPFDEVQQSAFGALLSGFIEQATFGEISGAKNMIAAIEANNDFGICYATGSLRRPAVFKLQHIGIAFDPVQLVASDGIEERERIVDLAIQQAQAFYGQQGFDRIISVGDGLWDLQTARNLGLQFAGVGALHQALLASHGATIHFTDWQQFQPELITSPVF